MEGRTLYYARVSSQDQNLDRQIEAFHAMGAEDRDIMKVPSERRAPSLPMFYSLDLHGAERQRIQEDH